jgi:putative FmdB family regulatory protein
MPTYDYECKACGHTFEELQSFSAPLLTKCPKCKKNKLERLFGGGGAIIFKGSGFYETDYRRAGESKDKSEGSDAAKTETKGEAKADAKSDTPAASPPPASESAAPVAKPAATGGKKKGK